MFARARSLLDLAPLSKRLPQRAFGLACYAVGGLTVPALILFCGDRFAKSVGVDRPARSTSLGIDLAVDLAMVALFGIQHSVMARPVVKRWLGAWVGESLQRSSYVLCSCLALFPLLLAWRPLPLVLWDTPQLGALFGVSFWFGAGVVYAAALSLDHFALLGLRQAWFGREAVAATTLNVAGPFRFVRHPLMTGLLLVFWSTPRMTLGHLCFATAMTVYVLVGTYFEERELVRNFGAAYLSYRARTSMLVPLPVWNRSSRSAVPGHAKPSSHG